MFIEALINIMNLVLRTVFILYCAREMIYLIQIPLVLFQYFCLFVFISIYNECSENELEQVFEWSHLLFIISVIVNVIISFLQEYTRRFLIVLRCRSRLFSPTWCVFLRLHRMPASPPPGQPASWSHSPSAATAPSPFSESEICLSNLQRKRNPNKISNSQMMLCSETK